MEGDPKMILWDIDAALATDNNPSHPLTLKTVTRKFSPGIIDLFQQFHSHYLISLLSTQIPHEEIVSLLQFNQIHHCIHAIHCSDDDARWRSHEEQGEGLSNIFEFILKKAKVKASDCVYISSSDHSTYRQMTKEMGIHSIGMGWDHNQLSAEDLFFQDPPSEIVHSADELLQAILRFSSKTQRRRRKSRSKSVSWQEDVIDNEGMGKLRTDDEYWDPSDRS